MVIFVLNFKYDQSWSMSSKFEFKGVDYLCVDEISLLGLKPKATLLDERKAQVGKRV